MDSMDVNKAVAAVLVAGIAFFVTGLIGDNLVHETRLEKSAIPIQEAAPAAGAGKQQQGLPPIAPLLASANVQKGQQFVDQVCAACHSFNKGGKPIIGPNLYGIVGAPHDHEAGFDYSSAMQKFKGQPWTFEALNKWLHDPAKYAPGTRMTYAGIKNDQTRADVIDYLHTLSDNPEPLPKVEATAPPAQGGAAGAAPGQPSPEAALDARLASADAAKGKQFVEQVCTVCHSLNQGGPTIVGPNLFGIVGAPHDHEQGFHYSPALEKFKGQPWTFAALDKWLTNPAAYAPGTMMTYQGIPKEQLRADVIAYLDTLSKNPVPLPKPGQAGKQAGQPQAAQEAAGAAATAPAPGTAAPAGNHSAESTAAAPNSAPASSPKTTGAPGSSYNAEAQTPNAGTEKGGTGAAAATKKPDPTGADKGAASAGGSDPSAPSDDTHQSNAKSGNAASGSAASANAPSGSGASGNPPPGTNSSASPAGTSNSGATGASSSSEGAAK